VGAPGDTLCKKCHDGPAHNPHHVLPGETGSCSSCHTEHRGRNSNLARSPDPTCTRCHANLPSHSKDGKTDFAASITRFDRDHPEFHLGPPGKRKPLGEAKDPGKLRFNHELHLLPGQKNKGEAGGKKLSDIENETLRKRYSEDKDHLIQLDCASCHQLDSTDIPGQPAQMREAGDYFLPVNFEQHCRACHPLTFSSKANKQIEIPHRLQLDDVRRYVTGALFDQKVQESRANAGAERPLPGKSLEEMRKATKEGAEELEAWFKEPERKTKGAQLTTCAQCHYFERKEQGGKETVRILPTNVPEVWFPHAKFSHQPHRMVKCADCHGEVEKSSHHTDVLLPPVKNCQHCHAPGKLIGNEPAGGVRYECTTCHLYHTGDNPLAGRGAANRGIKERKETSEVLSGKGK
jgi:predicted CXXCH cytochrome family protein